MPTKFSSALWLSAAAVAISLLVFAPHLWLMRTPLPGSLEWTRALEYLERCRHPFSAEVGPAMRWRFLPQLLAHGLHLGTVACLSIPWLGVIVLTVVSALILSREAELSPLTRLAALILVTTTAPVLCSTGWLGINDAWVTLGLVGVAFSSGSGWLAAATLACPWIDERFWFGLPAALTVRVLVRPQSLARREWAALVAASLPFALIRLWGLERGAADPSVLFLHDITTDLLKRMDQSRMGFWMGLRWAAVPLLLAWGSVWRQRGGLMAVWAGASLAIPLLVLAALASDSMRSVGIALPWVLYGLIELVRRTEGARWLVALAALQLLTPAAQITGEKIFPIDPLPIELYRLKRDPSVPIT